MSKQIISTDKAPGAIGTYSQAVKVGGTVYVSGQIPLHPETMEVVDSSLKMPLTRYSETWQQLLKLRAAAWEMR